MENINTDYKRRTWKVQAELFKIRKPWRTALSLNTITYTTKKWLEPSLPITAELRTTIPKYFVLLSG